MITIYATFPEQLKDIAILVVDGTTYINKNYEGSSAISAYQVHQ